MQAESCKAELSEARRQVTVAANTAALESRVSELADEIFNRDETIRDLRK